MDETLLGDLGAFGWSNAGQDAIASGGQDIADGTAWNDLYTGWNDTSDAIDAAIPTPADIGGDIASEYSALNSELESIIPAPPHIPSLSDLAPIILLIAVAAIAFVVVMKEI